MTCLLCRLRFPQAILRWRSAPDLGKGVRQESIGRQSQNPKPHSSPLPTWTFPQLSSDEALKSLSSLGNDKDISRASGVSAGSFFLKNAFMFLTCFSSRL